jgi:hypothetical protein
LITIAQAEKLFPPILSPCHSASMHYGYCDTCFATHPAPFYFIAEHQVSDEDLIAKEKELRASLPVGASVSAFWPAPC